MMVSMKRLHLILIGMGFLALPGIAPAVDFVDGGVADQDKVVLGQLLFHEKELSGNRNISCATCHHPLTDTGDGLSLPVGEGGRGLGVTRDTGTGKEEIDERVPRNAPPIFMLGSTEVTRMFHDGRIEKDVNFPSGHKSPAGNLLPAGLDNILAVQAMFPVTSPDEMAGRPGDRDVFGRKNEIADPASTSDFEAIWDALAERLRNIPEYVDLFVGTFDDINVAADITYAHAANAIAAFEIDAWRADNSPYDAYLAGDGNALTKQQDNGRKLFFGKAGCSGCHYGDILSDMDYHSIAMPQIGPGKGHGSGQEDWGRGPVSEDPADNFKFRTPPLRNVALTAPYGHSGAYNTLEEAVRHHLDPVGSLWAYDCETRPVLPSLPDKVDTDDCAVMNDDSLKGAIATANELNNEPLVLSDDEVDEIIAFLRALTDPENIDLRFDVPSSVPSGLTIIE